MDEPYEGLELAFYVVLSLVKGSTQQELILCRRAILLLFLQVSYDFAQRGYAYGKFSCLGHMNESYFASLPQFSHQ
jgi:hypothetical protein